MHRRLFLRWGLFMSVCMLLVELSGNAIYLPLASGYAALVGAI